MQRKFVHYQQRDAAAFDYQIYFLDGFHLGLRGPRLPWHLHDRYCVAVGSAGVFGRFSHQPYVHQLCSMAVPTVNLGLSGARPCHYLENSALKAIIAGSDTLLAEFMSGRGYATSFYRPKNFWGNKGDYLSPLGKVEEDIFVDQAWTRALSDYESKDLDAAVTGTRDAYVKDFCALIDEAGPRVQFLWLSSRGANYEAAGDRFLDWSGGFPHLIDDVTRRRIIDHARKVKGESSVRCVEVISQSGLPEALFERATGQPASIFPKLKDDHNKNRYYPSQAMHDQTAARLLESMNGWW